MKYLCLVYYEKKIMNALSQNEWDSLLSACLSFGSEVRHSGHFLGGEALQSLDTATTVRLRNGKLTLTDGPFAETKEQLAGFYLFEACDLNQAIQLAGRIPPARFGSIEVRPIIEYCSEPGRQLW